jgi:hypothetical protein
MAKCIAYKCNHEQFNNGLCHKCYIFITSLKGEDSSTYANAISVGFKKIGAAGADMFAARLRIVKKEEEKPDNGQWSTATDES